MPLLPWQRSLVGLRRFLEEAKRGEAALQVLLLLNVHHLSRYFRCGIQAVTKELYQSGLRQKWLHGQGSRRLLGRAQVNSMEERLDFARKPPAELDAIFRRIDWSRAAPSRREEESADRPPINRADELFNASTLENELFLWRMLCERVPEREIPPRLMQHKRNPFRPLDTDVRYGLLSVIPRGRGYMLRLSSIPEHRNRLSKLLRSSPNWPRLKLLVAAARKPKERRLLRFLDRAMTEPQTRFVLSLMSRSDLIRRFGVSHRSVVKLMAAHPAAANWSENTSTRVELAKKGHRTINQRLALYRGKKRKGHTPASHRA